MKKLISIGALSAATLMCATSASAVVLTGNYVQLGVNNGGSMIDYGAFTGIKFDPTGTSNFGAIDFLTPSNPFAFSSLGVGGVYAVAGGGSDTNPFHSTTVDVSGPVGSPFAITSRGSYGGLNLQQTFYFDNNSSTIHASVTFANTTRGAINNVAYGIGFDPDQDANANGEHSTKNTIVGQGVDATVTAASKGGAGATGYAITLNNTSGWDAKASIVSASAPGFGWNPNPYLLANNIVNSGDGDYTINLGYNLGNFAAGQQKTIAYDMVLTAPVPEPSTYAMMLAGLILLRHMARRKPKDLFKA